MSVLNPKDDAAALQPLVDKAVQEFGDQLTARVAPALGDAVRSALDGLEIDIKIAISKKMSGS